MVTALTPRKKKDRFPLARKPVRLGLVGGYGGFFGSILMRSANLHYPALQVVAGAVHVDPATAVQGGEELGIARPFGSVDEMLSAKDDLKLDGVLVATPNDTHYEIGRKVLDAGLALYLEKPMVTRLDDARDLRRRAGDLPCGQNFTYAGQAVWRKAAEIVSGGGIGDLLRIDTEYNQGWLWKLLNVWREKKAHSGPFNALFDIGVHCLFSSMLLGGWPITKVQTGIRINVKDRELDDDGWIEAMMPDGTPIRVHAVQVDQDGENDHRVRIVGSKGTITLDQRRTEELQICAAGQPHMTFLRGSCYSGNELFGRFFPEDGGEDIDFRALPSAHPEGLHDAIGRNIWYWAEAVARYREGMPPLEQWTYPTLAQGADLMEVLFAAHASVATAWTAAVPNGAGRIRADGTWVTVAV